MAKDNKRREIFPFASIQKRQKRLAIAYRMDRGVGDMLLKLPCKHLSAIGIIFG
jgi:hypothetical protein